jgi:hypothetical protein
MVRSTLCGFEEVSMSDDQSIARYAMRATITAALIQMKFVDMKNVGLADVASEAHTARIQKLKVAVDVLMTEVVYK